MKPYTFSMKSTVILPGVLILGIALSSCASGRKCLEWQEVTVGRMPSGVPITENKCNKMESEEDFKKRMEKEKKDSY